MENTNKTQVRKFYSVIWEARDMDELPSILHDDITFRGSLGAQTRGHEAFIEYVDMIHKALGDYRCIIEELLSESEKVFAKMKFTGIHQGELMGYAPTHQRATWNGAALFTFREDKVADLWVLGDLKSLENQLKQNVARG